MLKIPYPLHIKLCQRLPRIEDVEDVEQEILLDIFRCKHTFSGKSSYTTWCYSIALKKIADFWRDYYKRKYIESVYTIPDNTDNSAYHVLEQAIDKLEPANREIVMCRIRGFSWSELKCITGMTYPALANRYARAIKKIKNELRQDMAFLKRIC